MPEAWLPVSVVVYVNARPPSTRSRFVETESVPWTFGGYVSRLEVLDRQDLNRQATARRRLWDAERPAPLPKTVVLESNAQIPFASMNSSGRHDMDTLLDSLEHTNLSIVLHWDRYRNIPFQVRSRMTKMVYPELPEISL